MTGSAPPEQPDASRDEGSSLLARLVAECLDRVADQGPGAVEAFCQEHPEHAPDIRRRMEALQQMGLLEVRDPESHGVPETLGPFRLIRRLGAGGMGVVYLAEQTPLGRTVALKLMRPDQVFYQGSRERFQREVTAVARLHHPGIVSVHTAGEEGGIPWFAMEYVRGCSLVDALQALRPRQPGELSAGALQRAVRQHAPAGEDTAGTSEQPDQPWTGTCLRLTLQVAEALDHAHQKGIHHRDIKPSNLMITPDGRAMLLDFGLASASGTSRLTRSGSQLGSLPYMPPESLERSSAVDGARADVYSLGVTLYELLTLHCPFLDENPSVTIRKVLQGWPDPIRLRHPGVSWAAETVCLKAMDREPERRYASAREFAQDLRNALEHRPILARRPGWLLRVRRWSRRHPARAVAGVAAVLLLATSLTYGLMQRSTNQALTQAGREKDQLLENLQQRNAELDAALQEVDRSFGRVVDAGIRMLSRVGFDILQNVPLSDGVRRDLLDEAHALSLELQRDAPEDPRLRFEMARTLRLLGKFQGDMGDYQKGDPQLRRAAELYQGLVEEQPEHEDAQEQLARTWHALGASHMQRHQYAEAAEAFQQGGDAGLRMLELLAQEDAADLTLAQFRTVTASNLQGAASAYRFLARLEDADRAFTEARRLLGLMVVEYHPEQVQARAVSAINHSTVLLALGRLEEAEAAAREGVDGFQDMVDRQPGNAGLRANLGTALLMLQGTLEDDRAELVPLARQAVEELRTARRFSPGSQEARENLAAGLEILGHALHQEGALEEGREHLEEAVALLEALVGGQGGGVEEELVMAQVRLAECLVDLDEVLEGEDLLHQAVERSDPWLEDPAKDLTTRTYTVVALESLARFLWQEELLEDALPHARRAWEESQRQILARPEDPRIVEQLSTTALLTARIHLGLLDHAAAHEVLDSLRTATLTDPERLQGAALGSACIETAADDPDLGPTTIDDVRRRYVATAVALLEGVEDRSCLAAVWDETGAEFEALRGQPIFAEWQSRQ